MSAEWDKVETCAAALREARLGLTAAAALRTTADHEVRRAQHTYDDALYAFTDAKSEFAPGGAL